MLWPRVEAHHCTPVGWSPRRTLIGFARARSFCQWGGLTVLPFRNKHKYHKYSINKRKQTSTYSKFKKQPQYIPDQRTKTITNYKLSESKQNAQITTSSIQNYPHLWSKHSILHTWCSVRKQTHSAYEYRYVFVCVRVLEIYCLSVH